MSDIVRHYIWQDGSGAGKPVDGGGVKDTDIEKQWSGLKYAKCDGLFAKGKRKNIHIEKYSDSDEVRVWLDPNVVIREATEIVLSVYFTGENRHSEYDSFLGFISHNKIHYWDTKRKREAFMVLIDQTKPKEDVYKGSEPYIFVEFKFQNLRGECPVKEVSAL